MPGPRAALLLVPVLASACAMEASGVARQVLEAHFFSVLESDFQLARDQLLPACPFLPANEYFAAHEAFKIPWSYGKMKCRCGKIFRNEHYLDMHVSQRHANESRPAGGFCLARICDFVPCSAADASTFHPTKRGVHLCHSALNQCLPPEFTAAHEALEATFCQGKLRPSGRSMLSVLWRSLSWTMAIVVVGFYGYSWWARKAALGRGVGLERVKLAPKPVPLVTPPKRRQQVKADDYHPSLNAV